MAWLMTNFLKVVGNRVNGHLPDGWPPYTTCPHRDGARYPGWARFCFDIAPAAGEALQGGPLLTDTFPTNSFLLNSWNAKAVVRYRVYTGREWVRDKC